MKKGGGQGGGAGSDGGKEATGQRIIGLVGERDKLTGEDDATGDRG